MNTSKKLVLGMSAIVIVVVSGWVYFSKKISVDRQESEAASSNVYLSQSAAGSGDGSSCANARAVSFFNSSSNWGAGATQIGPGTVVRLCGTITSDMVTAGAGAAGNHVVIDGTGSTQPGDWNLRNNFITLRRINMPSDGIWIDKSAHDIVIENSYLANDCDSSPGDIVRSDGAYNVTIQGNRFRNCATSNDNHDDMIQTWGGVRDWVIRHNWFEMDTPAENNKSCHMLEGFNGKLEIYGNVYLGTRGAGAANCINIGANLSGMQAFVYNNTMVQKQGGFQPMWNLKGSGSIQLRNNISYSSGASNIAIGEGFNGSMVTRGNNLWFGPGSPSCKATEICGQNPQFVNLAGNNFALQPGSPALGKGTTLGAPYTTAVLQGATWPNPTLATRPAGAWDMGAFINSGGSGGGGTTGSSDLNTDGKVDVVDLGILLSAWGQTTKPKADINQDAKVDVVDLGILLGKWGTSG